MSDGTPDPTAWIGRSQQFDDTMTRNLAARIAITLDRPAPARGEALPPLWHWAYFQDPAPESGLGVDGHPARGGFLPPAADRNRMWAGGDVEFLVPLRVDGDASRKTTIEDVREKTGRTGSLLFVTLLHEIMQDGHLAIRERQNIVYRAPSPPKLSNDDPVPEAQWRQAVKPTETLLFRYSAVTFNAHRIHYDHPYVTQAEGYPGLVVHGPMLATLQLQAFADANPTARIDRLTYRGLRPLIAPAPFEVAGRITAPGEAQLWAANDKGLAHTAELRFTPA
ncbi:MaoC family dehydratase N-terminal domain-containing protein [Achromobacter sp. GG226]|uniref:FAS1-like dehydratase domain-containing protein n=1 Tax=Verticiella alkaliphila TaxID=2779529 RepID=UPI001C0B0C0F|nr:MaoC family dehydratase N-terminal domain-containing protein [Verticiella sp. GG226]